MDKCDPQLIRATSAIRQQSLDEADQEAGAGLVPAETEGAFPVGRLYASPAGSAFGLWGR